MIIADSSKKSTILTSNWQVLEKKGSPLDRPLTETLPLLKVPLLNFGKISKLVI